MLLHVENQARVEKEFAERMFIYFSRLYQEHRCRILPIAVFSYWQKRNEPDNFNIEFPFMPVLNFHFLILELNKHNWKDYITSNNPVAAALLSKMDYEEKDRVQVKLEFLRMLVYMELDPARMTLLAGFFETYLQLNEEEKRELAEKVGKIDKKEAERMMEITTSWQEKGRIEGKKEGQTDLLIQLLRKKFTNIPADIETGIRSLSGEKLQVLAEAIFELETVEDVRAFIQG